MTKSDIYQAFIDKRDKLETNIAMAAFLGVTPQYVSDIINHRRQISKKVGKKIGWTKVVTWVPKE